jgi:8-oxo-dGTP pyrophosphatase MutT (NUDIX family)
MEARGPLKVLVYPVAPVESTHEFLLLRRISSRGGFWQGVTGGVKPGESLDEAAVRELVEETALTPRRILDIGYQYPFRIKRATRSSPIARATEHVFVALLDAKVDPDLDSAEHDAWDWFTYEDALKWLRWPENVEALRRCEALITAGPSPGAA